MMSSPRCIHLTCARKIFRARFHLTLLLLSFFLSTGSSFAQSTYGSFLGTVKDPQGATVGGATVKLINTGTSSTRETTTSSTGQYSFLNVEPGSYRITVGLSGFQELQFSGLVLQSRDTHSVDGVLTLGQRTETVSVETGAAVVNTDTSNLSETRTGIELNTLPLAVSSRASGSTSRYATMIWQAGVQPDAAGNISVAGAKPSLLSVTVDGISTMNVRSSIPATELFPSFNAIEEIRISQNANAAEFGGISDITTVSRGGTNHGHGGIFDNYESAGFNSKDPFAATKPKLVMNDFGIFDCGSVIVPHLYNGRDKTFYFLSYEGLRLPQQLNVIQSVPTAALRAGNLSAYSTQINNASGVPYLNNQIPTSDISPVSAKALAMYYPLPNYGAAGAMTGNYQQNFSTPISSDQGDVRIDRNITSRQTVYVRYSYKQRSVVTPPTSSASNGGSALVGIFRKPEKDTSLTVAYNYIITPPLFNEFRGGLSEIITESNFNRSSASIAALGIQGIPDLISPSIAASPNFRITGFTAAGGVGSAKSSSNTYPALNNLPRTKGAHTIKKT